MKELISVLFLCFIGGFLPLFLILKSFKIENRLSVIFSIGFTPVYFSILNIILILLNIEDSILLKYLVLFIPYLFVIKEIKKLFVLPNKYSFLNVFIPSLAVGLVFCNLVFPDFFIDKQFYADVEFNLTLVQDLKSHFLPVDPNWKTDQYLIYHFGGDIFIASLSNFLNYSIVQIYKSGFIFLSISIFIIIGYYVKKNVLENLIISLIVLVFSFSNNWDFFNSFHSHIAESGSTFFMSIPVFFASYFLWKEIDQKRMVMSLKNQILFSLILVFSIVFFKSTLIIIIMLLELFSLILFIFKNRILFKNLKILIVQILNFTIIPILSFWALYLISSKNESMLFLGLESRDFYFFHSWSFYLPFLMLFSTPVIFIIFNFYSTKINHLFLLFTSVFNLLLLLIVKHEGHSDLYFGFNIILINLLFYIEFETDYKLKKFISSYFCAYYINFSIDKSILNFPLNYDKKQFVNTLADSTIDNAYFKIVDEYENIGKKLDENVVLAVKNYGEKQFKFSAYMGVRTWNGCSSYAHSTVNSYLPDREFLAQQPFFPNHYPKNTHPSFDRNNYKTFLKTFKPDTIKYELPQKRYAIYEKLSFNDLSTKERRKILLKTGITHIQIDTCDLKKISNWMKTLNFIKGETVYIYSCY